VKFSRRVQSIKPSPTLAVTARIQALRAEGIDVIGFGAGEPDFDTPVSIKEAAVKALEMGFTKYTPVGGLPSLKQAILARLQEDDHLTYGEDELMVSAGGKQCLFNICQALLDEGDEFLIPSPYWTSFPDMVLLAGAEPRPIVTEESTEFKITPEQLQKAIRRQTRGIVLNSPSNPTGAVYTRKELEAIGQIIDRHGLIVISDDVYSKIVYAGFRFFNIVQVYPELRMRTLIVHSMSKTYAMTGWRIGYVVGPKEAIAALSKIQDQSTSNANSIAQKAAEAALAGPQEEVQSMVQEFERRRDFIVERLNAMDGVSCFLPQGAFYAFPRVSELFGRSNNGKKITNSEELSSALLTDARVAVVPGEAFGSKEHIRLSYATSMAQIEEGLDRMENFFRSLV
jgi:aspartate aminotransferase